MKKTFKGIGAIFCGGKSLRMGVSKSGIILPDGKTLIEHVYSALDEVCEEIVLVGHGEGVPQELMNLERIEDNYQGIGPIGALEALLNSQLADEYLVVSCDLLKITQEALDFLLSQEGKLPIVLRSRKGLEPLIGRYPSDLLPMVRKQIENKQFALHKLISAVNATIISIPKELEFALINVNTPEDLI